MTDPSKKNRSSERFIEADKACVWHPFTPMRQWLAGSDDRGRVIVAGEGFELIDAAGRRYIDGFSSLWCNLHGHRVKKIDDAVRAQLGRIAHTTLLGHASPAAIELAERLESISPGPLEKVFFSDSGATAVEVALKMAFQYYRNLGRSSRQRFIALKHSYHGDTIGSVSLGGIDTFGGIFRPLLFETTFVDSPNSYHHPAGGEAAHVVLEQIDDALTAAPDEYCAVIVEPLIQGAAGMLTHPPGFLAGVRELTKTHGVLLIVDEVATGFCRTGRLFACEHEHVAPDLMCLGKGLTGGYMPVAATLATREIFDAFLGEPHEHKTFYHGHTYTGNALGCAAAAASIDLIFESNLLTKLPEKVQLIARKLAAIADHPNVGDIRQCGCMVGIELVRSRAPRQPLDAKRRVGEAVYRLALGRNIIIRPLGDVVVLMPAPAMDLATLERLLDGVVQSIRDFFDRTEP